MSVCLNCGTENPKQAGFCGNCGAALPGASVPSPPRSDRTSTASANRALSRAEADRRFCTILFADIAGFTSLSETHDPETVRELVNAFFDRLVPIVEAHHGTVDQFVGDEIVALFGAPVAHENDPVQACRTALEMMRAVPGISAELGFELGLHIGINSGTVISGGIGSSRRRQYSVLGDAVNVAARLEGAAERGEIFVGAETHKLVRDQFEFAARGQMELKGKAAPQTVWQLIGERADAPLHRLPQTLTPLIGRAREMGILARVLREIGSEHVALRVVSILGEAGIGKSRLVQEWQELAQEYPLLPPNSFVVVGCAPEDANRDYALLTRLLNALNETADEGIAPPVIGRAAPSAQTLQQEYTRALARALWRRSAGGALVLVCQDIHWADRPSLELLYRALEQGVRAPLILGLAARHERESAGWELLEKLAELPGVATVQINLTPLTESDAALLLGALVPGGLPLQARRLVLAHAEGNPLFVEELIQMLRDRGDLQLVGGKWELTRPLVSLDVPNTLQDVLMARLDRLPARERMILQLAAVLGREFPLDALEELSKNVKLPAR